MSFNADGEPVEVGESPSSRRKIAILAAVIISLAVVLSAFSYFVFFSASEPSTMTMTQLADKMSDTSGDGFPDDYIPYDEGDNVTVRDHLIGYDYHYSTDLGHSYSLHFPYTGNKWKDLFGSIGYVPAYLFTNSSLCTFGYGDWITLNGTVEVFDWSGNRTELMNWTIVGNLGPFELPVVELNLTEGSETTWSVTVSNCTLECRLWHFDFLLKRYGMGIDWVRGLEHGERSIYMEFWDMDGDGCLSEGDVLSIMPEEEGDYEVVLLYHSDELGSGSFSTP